jgi:hypothetical protein
MAERHPGRPQQPDAGFDEGQAHRLDPEEEPDFARGQGEDPAEPADDFAKGQRSEADEESEGTFATGMEQGADPDAESRAP